MFQRFSNFPIHGYLQKNVKKIKSVTKMTNFVSNHYCSENLYKTFYVVKFIYSEKETKFCEIFTIDWHFKGQK